MIATPKAGQWATVTLAILGMAPCLWAKISRSRDEGFWAAAWLTSTVFGAIHSTNSGETYIGVLDAGVAGFQFCVAIKVTGSVWWSLGSHAAWDWMQTYFLGSPDSGLVAVGHLLTTTPAGPRLLSGGTTGPEGSLVGLFVDFAVIAALLISQWRSRSREELQPIPSTGV